MQFLILTSFTYLIIFDVDKKKFTKKSKANRLIKSIKMPINERLHLIKYIQKHTIGNNEDLTSLSDAELRNRVQVIESGD